MVHCLTPLVLSGAFVPGPPPPPVPEQVVDDPVTGARCHYERPGDASTCADVLAYLQVAWEVQVEELGWPAPFEDGTQGGTPGLDIFLSIEAAGGAWTTSDYNDADPDDGRMGGMAYIVLDPDLPADELDIYVAHEFTHALQFALDFTEPTYPPWEGVATLMEEATFAGRGSWAESVPDFQEAPWASLLSDGDYLWEEHELWVWYEYGSALFFEYLAQQYAIEPVDFWWAMTHASLENEPDAWDAVDALTGDADAALLGFSIARARVGTAASPAWASNLDAPLSPPNTIRQTRNKQPAAVAPYVLGAAWYEVEVEGLVAFHIEGDPATRWGIVVVEEGTQFIGTDPVELEGPATIGVVNLGPFGFDPDDSCDWACEFDSHSVTAWVQPVSSSNNGDGGLAGEDIAGEDSGGVGCGCSTRPHRPILWVAVLVAFGLKRRMAPTWA
jgi:hypothetical protein